MVAIYLLIAPVNFNDMYCNSVECTSVCRIPNGTLIMNSDIVSSTVFGVEEGDLDNLTEPVVIVIQHQVHS